MLDAEAETAEVRAGEERGRSRRQGHRGSVCKIDRRIVNMRGDREGG